MLPKILKTPKSQYKNTNKRTEIRIKDYPSGFRPERWKKDLHHKTNKTNKEKTHKNR